MKVVHIASYKTGGAGIATSRIHNRMFNEGIDSRLIFLEDLQKTNLIRIYLSRVFEFLKRNLSKKKSFLKDEYLFLNNKELLNSGLNTLITSYIKEADIIFIHWVSNMLNTFDVLKLFKKTNARIVYVMMDMAHITGGCHYPRNCINYRINCIDCPALVYSKKEIAHKQQLSKSLNISKFKGEIIAFSDIDLNNAKKSSIPFYKFWRLDIPFDKHNILNIEINKFIILPSAYSFLSKRKGIDYFKQVLYLLESKLSNSDEIYIYNTDYPDSFIKDFSKIKFIKFNFYSDINKLIELYESSSLLCFTSISDSAPQMIIESLMSNTKVISFDVGYANEIINSNNGYIIQNYNVHQMVDLIFKFYKEKSRSGFVKDCNISKSIEKYYNNEKFLFQLNQILNG